MVVIRVFVFFLLTGLSSFASANQEPLFPALNWGVVEENKVYRSRKLSSLEFIQQLRKYSLRSVLCLASCTKEEKEIAKTYKIKYYDLTVNIPEITLVDLDDIVEVLKESPKPLLIHCRQGADRTGLAAALYFLSIKGEAPKVSIKKGLKLRHGHLGKLFLPGLHHILHEYILENY